jgi:hypothetical protein
VLPGSGGHVFPRPVEAPARRSNRRGAGVAEHTALARARETRQRRTSCQRSSSITSPSP